MEARSTVGRYCSNSCIKNNVGLDQNGSCKSSKELDSGCILNMQPSDLLIDWMGDKSLPL